MNRSFTHFPMAQFLVRQMVVFVVVSILGFPMIGVLARLPSVQALEKAPSALVPPRLVQNTGVLGAALDHLTHTQSYLTQTPDACRSGQAKSDFLIQECQRVEWRAWVALAIACSPFGLGLIAVLFFLDQGRLFYKNSARKIQQRKRALMGKVTRPAKLSADFFSWLFCLQRISMIGSDGEQQAIYMPADLPTPLPGEQVAAYDLGKRFGRRRFSGALYAPHMAVVRGDGKK